ncbi:MAG: flagellar assembly protein FliW [Lutisporaceae bacterium]
MIINTKFLGDIEIEEKGIISFDNGIPGFTELRKFVLLPVEGNPSLYYMQSIDEATICFITISPFVIVEDYEADISAETVEKLDIAKVEDVSMLSILTIPKDIKEITANLQAPIVINNTNNKAFQEILNNDNYSVKYKLYRGE